MLRLLLGVMDEGSKLRGCTLNAKDANIPPAAQIPKSQVNIVTDQVKIEELLRQRANLQKAVKTQRKERENTEKKLKETEKKLREEQKLHRELEQRICDLELQLPAQKRPKTT